jgi:hypothetical protein
VNFRGLALLLRPPSAHPPGRVPQTAARAACLVRRAR